MKIKCPICDNNMNLIKETDKFILFECLKCQTEVGVKKNT